MSIQTRKHLKTCFAPATLLVILAGIFIARTTLARIVINTIDPVGIVAVKGPGQSRSRRASGRNCA